MSNNERRVHQPGANRDQDGDVLVTETGGRPKKYYLVCLKLVTRIVMAFAHVISLSVVAFILYNVKPGSIFFSWHPTLMVLGYGFIMFEAIMVFSGSPLFAKLNRPGRINLHGLLNSIAIACALGGVAVAYTNKNVHGKPHFVTIHSKIGAAANTLVFAVAMGGLLSKYASSLGRAVHPPSVRKMHAFAAVVVFSIACAAMVTGMGSDYFVGIMVNAPPFWRFAQLLPICLSLVVIAQVFNSYAPRLRTKP